MVELLDAGFGDLIGDVAGQLYPPSPSTAAFLGIALAVLLLAWWIERLISR